jgi:cysteine-rich repeat protein
LLMSATTATAQSQPTSQPVCGDGVVESSEECDDGKKNSTIGQCSPTCTLARCGDGVRQPATEQCDDGNSINGDGCFKCKKTSNLSTNAGKEEDPIQSSEEDLVDAQDAFRVAIATTLFGPPVLGAIYGPSIPHWKAGEKGRAAGTAILRGLLLGGQVAGFVALSRGATQAGDSLLEGTPIGALLVIDGLVFSVLVCVDLIEGPRAIERANKKVRGE